jgi:hypothetical protein
MTRTKLVHLLGRNENELLAYDEYDSEGSGKWFTDNPIMAEEYNCQRACEDAEKEGLNVYLWEVTYDSNEKQIIKEEIWVQFSNEEAIKWKNERFEAV